MTYGVVFNSTTIAEPIKPAPLAEQDRRLVVKPALPSLAVQATPPDKVEHFGHHSAARAMLAADDPMARRRHPQARAPNDRH